MPVILQTALGQRSHVNVCGNDFNTLDGTGSSLFQVILTQIVIFDRPPDEYYCEQRVQIVA